MGRRLRSSLALACATLMAVSAWGALAGQQVMLRADVASGATVTLGDLFDNAGSSAKIMVGYGAPAGQIAVLDAGEVQRIAHIHGLDWSNPNGIRRIMVRSEGRAVADPAGPAETAGKMIQALTYARNMGAGEIVQPTDLTYASVPAFSAPQDMPRDADVVIGKVARRPLRMGSAVAVHDISTPQVIKRGDIVQVAYRDDGISLVLQGKAMDSAALGEPVAVMNTVSNKVIQAIAAGPDEAVVGPAAEEIRAKTSAVPAQFAALR
ncbi:MAG: flagellar basal body P-ring formation chaperone FlgA [Caulobacteraceae bacterium]|nr:flagellar basal body P-ring formation chaperone FlgA [Caulobacteraceae bacterium]